MGNIARFQDIESLLQIHTSAESLFSCSREDRASQVWFGIIPLPQRSELDSGLDRQAIAMIRSIYRNYEDMFPGK